MYRKVRESLSSRGVGPSGVLWTPPTSRTCWSSSEHLGEPVAGNLVLVPGSGVDLTKYAQKSIPEGVPVVMLAARMLAYKGVREFVAAAELVNSSTIHARFVLVGNIDLLNPASIQQKEIDQWEKDGKVEFWGYCEEMAEVIPSATIIEFAFACLTFGNNEISAIFIDISKCSASYPKEPAIPQQLDLITSTSPSD